MGANDDASRQAAATITNAGRPHPAWVRCPADFVIAMRQLKSWSGLSYRRLESRASQDDAVLPRSTLMTALSRDSLPREDLVTAFVRACGCDEDEVAQWTATRRRLAVGAATGERPVPDSAVSDRADADQASRPASRSGSGWRARSLHSRLVPPFWYHTDKAARMLILALAATIVVVSTLAAAQFMVAS